MFEGLSVAMVTPFARGNVDWDSVDRLVDYLIDGGVHGIVPSGTTGEGPTLSEAERRELFERVVARSAGRVWVLAGTGSNNTAQVIATTKMARAAGADGALVVTPYYNRPSQAGLLAHFQAVADEGGLPVCLYNVPGRTGVRLEVESICTLASHPQIVAIKEACGSLDMVTEICRETDLTVLSGDDTLTLPMLAVGAAGVVSVLGNVVPKPLRRMLDAWSSSDLRTARSLHQGLFDFTQTLFAESNPTPVKHVLAKLGLIEEQFRLPLVPVRPETANLLDSALERLPLEISPLRSRPTGAAHS